MGLLSNLESAFDDKFTVFNFNKSGIPSLKMLVLLIELQEMSRFSRHWNGWRPCPSDTAMLFRQLLFRIRWVMFKGLISRTLDSLFLDRSMRRTWESLEDSESYSLGSSETDSSIWAFSRIICSIFCSQIINSLLFFHSGHLKRDCSL